MKNLVFIDATLDKSLPTRERKILATLNSRALSTLNLFLCSTLISVFALGHQRDSKAQDLQFLLPTHGQQSYIQNEGARILEPGKWNLNALIHYGRDPLLLIVRAQVEEVLLRYITTAELSATFGVHDRIELGIAVPYSFTPGINGTFPVDDARGLGDLRVNPKLILIKAKEGRGFGFGMNLLNVIPTGDYERDAEELRFVRRNFSSIINTFSEYLLSHGRVALNLGYRFRPLRGDFDPTTDLDVSSGPTWGFAAGFYIDEGLELTGEVFQRFMDYDRSPLEGLLAIRSTRKGAFNILFGMGAGIGGDYSSVGLRMITGLTWTPQPSQSGGVPLIDTDQDGLIDLVDRCPSEPEDKDGHDDFDGCPEDDIDQDGIGDAEDRCPREAEDRDQFEDQDGCPDLDNDGDRIPDTLDRCPLKAENYNQIEDQDGCPDEEPPQEGELIGLSEKIFFTHNESVILAKSYPVLAQVAELLKRNPQIMLVRIEGHTDDTGGLNFNLKLSQDRAKAVKLHLVSLGVDISRLEAVGYGDQRTIASNDTEEGRALNRRVDFRIIKGPQEIFKVDRKPPISPQKRISSQNAESPGGDQEQTANTVKLSGKSYAIQVKASYRLKDAEKIRDMISKERFPTYILSIEQDDGNRVHRVRIGPYANKSDAQKAQSEYQARFPESGGDYMVKITPSEAKKYR